jgi:hypothetical protein
LAEHSVAISCRIFVFGRNKKICFRSITNCWSVGYFPFQFLPGLNFLYLQPAAAAAAPSTLPAGVDLLTKQAGPAAVRAISKRKIGLGRFS